MKRTRAKKAINVSRHERDCRVCAHRDREDIEREFCEWKPIAAIAKARRIPRASLYRHVRAMGLFDKRDRNVKAALARFIERGHNVHVTAAAYISAIQAYAKINAEGEWIDKTENVTATKNLAQFDRMTVGEMRKYAETGELPEWWNLSGTAFGKGVA